MYATHTIQSAALLTSKLLLREREVDFNMRNDVIQVDVEVILSLLRKIFPFKPFIFLHSEKTEFTTQPKKNRSL